MLNINFKISGAINSFSLFTVKYQSYILPLLLVVKLTALFIDFSCFSTRVSLIIFSTTYAAFAFIMSNKLNEKKSKENMLTLKQSNRILETLMYSMAHDLKSPVRSAAGILNIMNEDLKEGELNQSSMCYMLGLADNSLKIGMETIDEVLDYAKYGQNLQIKNKVNVDKDLSNMLLNFEENCFIRYNSIGILSVDKNAFKRVIYNLVDNGLKYNSKNKKLVEVYRTGDTVIVEDNGNGIEEKYFERIVKPFQRLDSDTEGTGLGLGIVSKILELHGFKLRIKSELGKGSRFEILLR